MNHELTRRLDAVMAELKAIVQEGPEDREDIIDGVHRAIRMQDILDDLHYLVIHKPDRLQVVLDMARYMTGAPPSTGLIETN